MLTIETTPHCGQTPRILFLLEELGEPYALVLHDDGWFFRTYGRPGPLVRDGALELHLGLTAFRHLARTRGTGQLLLRDDPAALARIEQWIDHAWGGLGLGIVALLEARKAGHDASGPEARIRGTLRALELALTDRAHLESNLSAADCAFSNLERLGQLVDLVPFPNVRRYAAALSARPAAARVARAMAGVAQPEDVLSFWFGAPATDEAGALARVRRWFMSGDAMDPEVRARFGATVEAALSGGLTDWEQTPRGALALVVVLDQLARHRFRGDRRAYDGDARAVAVAERAVARGDLEALATTHERQFLAMPMLHAEALATQQVYAELVERIALLAEPWERAFVDSAREQSAKYTGVVRRFGRFPHRNTILGRASTPEEEVFLQDWARLAPPEIARPAS